MGIEMIMGIVITILAAIVGAFGLGKSRGTSIAETKADQQRTEERVQQTVNHLPDDDVNRELRSNWTRKG